MPSASSSNIWVASMVRMFASQGIEPDELFELAGMDIARLKRPHERFTSREVNRLWRVAVHRTGKFNLGLDRALARRYVRFDMATQSMWNGSTLLDSLEGFAKYLTLINDAGAFAIYPGHTHCWLQLSHGGNPRAPRQRAEFGLLALLLLCQKVAQEPIRPVAVEFTGAEPEDLHAYRMAFHCPLRFGQPFARLCMPTAELAKPVMHNTDSLFALHDKLVEHRLERLADARTSFRASEEIIRRLHLGVPTRADVARSVGVPEMELEKRLRAEGQSFAQLLDDVRRELAQHYLEVGSLPLAQITGLLGWEAPADFSAASKRWFGVSPLQYRRRLVAGS
ncbi:AraC family transcriptional regulator ligand-binding domain-containing protein [Caenimonas koreensis]|uniref:AraC family transcriptional regulator n=1 Tax=Caenimonas koreensis TaxID=367474 RepID=UPI0037851055